MSDGPHNQTHGNEPHSNEHGRTRRRAGLIVRAVRPVAILPISPVRLPVTAAKEVESVDALSIHGEPQYTAKSKHFEYANPDAPKSGDVRPDTLGTFNDRNSSAAKKQPFSADDVVSSFETPVDRGPQRYRLYYANVKSAEKPS